MVTNCPYNTCAHLFFCPSLALVDLLDVVPPKEKVPSSCHMELLPVANGLLSVAHNHQQANPSGGSPQRLQSSQCRLQSDQVSTFHKTRIPEALAYTKNRSTRFFSRAVVRHRSFIGVSLPTAHLLGRECNIKKTCTIHDNVKQLGILIVQFHRLRRRLLDTRHTGSLCREIYRL